MKIIRGDIWKCHATGAWVGIPTNGYIKNNGNLVMGRGLALQASERFPELPAQLGAHVNANGNTVCMFPKLGIFTFPTKHNWIEPADMNLIESSAQQLADYFAEGYNLGADLPMIALPKVGCGNGELPWKEVEPIIRAYLGEIVTIVDYQ